MSLLFLGVLVLVALAVILTVRAIQAQRAKQQFEGDYEVWQLDNDQNTQIRISRPRSVGRLEAVIDKDDPDYSNRVIEEWAKAEVKAREWNSTKRALV